MTLISNDKFPDVPFKVPPPQPHPFSNTSIRPPKAALNHDTSTLKKQPKGEKTFRENSLACPKNTPTGRSLRVVSIKNCSFPYYPSGLPKISGVWGFLYATSSVAVLKYFPRIRPPTLLHPILEATAKRARNFKISRIRFVAKWEAD